MSTCSTCPVPTNVTGSPQNRDRGNHRRQVPPAALSTSWMPGPQLFTATCPGTCVTSPVTLCALHEAAFALKTQSVQMFLFCFFLFLLNADREPLN